MTPDVNSTTPSVAETAVPNATPIPIDSWTSEQRDEWLKTGEPPKAAESATDADAAAVDAPAKTDDGKTQQEVVTPKKGVAKRNEQLDREIKQLHEKLRTRGQLREQLATDEPGEKHEAAPPAAKSASDSKPPKLADFPDWDSYEAAKDEYFEARAEEKAKAAVLADRQEQAKLQKDSEIKAANEAIAKSWNTRVDQARGRYEDFDAVAFAVDIPVNAFMDGFILESPIGPDIVYHLASNMEEAEKIQAMNPFQAGRELTRLESTIQSKLESKGTTTPAPRKLVSRASPPATEVGGKAAAPEDPVAAALASGDFTAYARLKNKREFEASK
jgi:hypothetical protein